MRFYISILTVLMVLGFCVGSVSAQTCCSPGATPGRRTPRTPALPSMEPPAAPTIFTDDDGVKWVWVQASYGGMTATAAGPKSEDAWAHNVAGDNPPGMWVKVGDSASLRLVLDAYLKGQTINAAKVVDSGETFFGQYAEAHSSHESTSYVRNHTTFDGQFDHRHEHNHSGTINVNHQQRGYYWCDCNQWQPVVYSRQYRTWGYTCPTSRRWIAYGSSGWNPSYFRSGAGWNYGVVRI